MAEQTLSTPQTHSTVGSATIERPDTAAERQREAHDITYGKVHTPHEHGEHDGHGVLHHHFEDMAQQRESITLGMWGFLCTEVMMFGGLLFCYALYRFYFYPAFVAGSHHLDITLGTINTFVLLFSSLTMALSVRCAQMRMKKGLVGWMIATIILGGAFLGIKAKEWSHDYHVGLVPVLNWNPELADAAKHGDGHGDGAKANAEGGASTHDSSAAGGEKAENAYDARTNPERAESTYLSNTRAGSTLYVDPNSGKRINKDNMQMYFFLYFCMTGLHAIHMVIGMGVLGFMTWLGWKGQFTNGNDQPVELLGLYWHFVDIVWIFLFPLLYLIGGR